MTKVCFNALWESYCIFFVRLPRIFCSVRLFSQEKRQKPATHNLKLAQETVRYLYGSEDRGITVSDGKNVWTTCMRKGFCDATYSPQRSQCGCARFCDTLLLLVESKVQSGVAVPTTEAEYRSCASATRHLIYLKELLLEFGASTKLILHCDNLPVIQLQNSGSFIKAT